MTGVGPGGKQVSSAEIYGLKSVTQQKMGVTSNDITGGKLGGLANDPHTSGGWGGESVREIIKDPDS